MRSASSAITFLREPASFILSAQARSVISCSIQRRLRLDDPFLDIEDACQPKPGVVRDSLLSALLLLPLDEEIFSAFNWARLFASLHKLGENQYHVASILLSQQGRED